MYGAPVVIALAAIPFLAKAVVLSLGWTGYVLQSLYKLFQLLIPVIWRRRWQGWKGRDMFWPFDQQLPGRRTIALSLISALVLSLLGILFISHANLDASLIRLNLDDRFGIVSPSCAVLVVIFLSVINSAIEELHFRAWMDTELSRIWGNAAGIIISALAFGGMHILIFYGMTGIEMSSILKMATALAVAGAVWSLIMRREGGIHAAFISHALTDAIVLGWGLTWLGYV